MKVIPVFFIFILATSCSTFKVPVMSRQLKVAYQTTAFENHSCDQVVFFTCALVLFHFKETSLLSVHPCQLSHFRNKLHACRYKTLWLYNTCIYQVGDWYGKKFIRE